MNRRSSLFVIILSLLFSLSCTRKNPLEEQIKSLLQGKDLRAGVAVVDMSTGQTTSVLGNESFPMLSVFKFHVAAKVLDDVDQGKWSLDQQVDIAETEILADTYSPLREEHGQRRLSMRLDSLLYYMVALSDNNACDILLRRIGGPAAVHDYVQRLGIGDTRIEVNEEEMHLEWEAQFRNTTTPLAMAELLRKFYLREFLSGDMHNFLWSQMEHTPTGKKRLRKGLPDGSKVIHKTGTSGRNDAGLSAATHDVGYIVLPDGRTYIVAIFVSDSMESNEVNEKLIADIAAAIAAS